MEVEVRVAEGMLGEECRVHILKKAPSVILLHFRHVAGAGKLETPGFFSWSTARVKEQRDSSPKGQPSVSCGLWMEVRD